MLGVISAICFVIAIVISVVDKSGNAAKLALEFAFAGGVFLALHCTFSWYPWRHGGGPA